jgi:hypothetical protein
MKKRYNIQYLLALMFTLALVGCSNDDFLTTQSDEAKVMSFSIGTSMEEVASKASTDYRAWKTGDPTSFGAYGIYNRNMTTKLFDNQEVTRSDSKWTYTPLKYWADYTWCETFDFFGYMPYKEEGVSFTQGTGADVNKYTLSFPVTLGDANSDGKNDAVTSTASEVPLICHAPVHKTVVGDVINYEMDQVLTGFTLKFMLGTKMTALRDFVIKEVKIKGAANEMPYSGTVSRTYTYDPSNDSWSSGDVTWTDITNSTTATEFTVLFVDHDGDKTIYDNTNSTLRIGYSDPVETVADARQWGNPFYAIPSEFFNPTIEVKYDVTVKDENGTYITTRSNIVSTIKFKDDNFTTYTAAGAVAKVHPIVVQIVPAYLFVLADADQRLGYLVIQD